MKFHYFDEIDISKLEDYYSQEVQIGPDTIEIDLNFDSESISTKEANKLNSIIEKIPKIIEKSWRWIENDFKRGVDVKDFIAIHLDNFFSNEIDALLQNTNTTLSQQERFLETLKVNRIGLYPFDNEYYLIIDWMVNSEFSDYILVINVKSNLTLNYITIES